MQEREMLYDYVQKRKQYDEFKDSCADAKLRMEKAEEVLINALESKGALCTSKYEGIGQVRLNKPRLYANVNKDNHLDLISFLNKNGEQYLIKETVHPSALSSFVGRMLGEGKDVPEFINYIFKQSVTYTN